MDRKPTNFSQSLAKFTDALAAYIAATRGLQIAAHTTRHHASQCLHHAHTFKHALQPDRPASSSVNVR
jgi:hypothetical protein